MRENLPKEVENYEADFNVISNLHFDGEKWFVTPEWAATMNKHLDALLPLAKKGNAHAQGALGWLLHSCYLYSDLKEAEKNYPTDIEKATYWLMRSAENGLSSNLDGVLSIGKGEEHDRLRKLFEDNKSEFTGASPPLEGWVSDMKKLKELYFGS